MNQEVYYSNGNAESKWSALDTNSKHPLCGEVCEEGDDVVQNAEQLNKTLQLSEEYILIKDSCDVTVTTTDTKAAVNLQASLQVVIALVISIAVASSQEAEKITQELLQHSKVKQVNYQKTVIENSRNVDVSTTDTQIGVNIQILLQILLALLVHLDIL
ncbi:spore coat protein [Halalkalibacter urbisdiaboli]|uniref:spore coat protein n=1 Tax=Halalkalibacter urbisdiaboli TaxID=1960589 RepID=UPI000B44B93A|nr:spore coat protein [Halalkalibacter urbisdiaboli]